MSEVNRLLQKRAENIEKIPDRFVRKVGATQQQVFNELMIILGRLGLDDGVLELNTENLLLVEELMNEYYNYLKDGVYGDEVRNFMSQFDAQRDLSIEYNTAAFGSFKRRNANVVYRQSKRRSLQLLLGDDFKTNFINVVRDQIVSSIEGGATFTELRKNLRPLFKNDQRLPIMQNWASQIAMDAFSIADRNYNDQVAKDLDLEFGQYFGGLVSDSRKFCVARAGKYFHAKEVEGWANLQWAGKYRNTNAQNIFEWLGGYRCGHLFAWVSTITVPKDVISRNMESGNYKPDKRERELLDL